MTKVQVVYDNLTKPQESCYNLIQTLGIYELRALARVFGDNSPTTSKRNDHIKVIMDKIISGEDIRPIPLRQGRPYKELSNIQGILEELSVITGKDYTLKSAQAGSANNSFKKVVNFKQDEEEVLEKHLDPIYVSGIVLNRSDKEFYLINQENNVPVLIKKEGFDRRVKEFDRITGTAVIMNNNHDYLLVELKTINYMPVDKYEVKVVNFDLSVPNNEINLGSTNIKIGGRYLVDCGKFLDLASLKTTIANLKKNGTKCVALIPNVLFEDIVALNSVGFDDLFLLKYNDSPSDYNEKVNVFIEHIKRLQEVGYSVAVFAQDLVTIAHTLDADFKLSDKSYFGHTEETATIIKNIMLLAKSTRGGSTTLFVTHEDSDNFDPLYITSISKISTKISL